MILDVSTRNKDFDEKIENRWFEWEKECCIFGIYDFEDFEEMVLTSLYRDGEVFLHLIKGSALKLELIDVAAIDNSYSDERKNIKFGIGNEPNSLKPKAYYVRKNEKELLKIPADDIIHIKKSLIPTQRRGISRLGASIFDAHQKGALKKAELDRARVSSSITGFFVRKNEEYDYDEDDDKPIVLPQGAQVGKMELIGGDVEPKFIPAYNPTNTEYFMKSIDREIARNLGISYSTYTGDLSEIKQLYPSRHYFRAKNI